MKKLIYFVILFFSTLLIVNAEGINNYRMDITILDNGNLYIMEAFEMNDVYNGFERNIKYKNNFTNYYGNLLSLTKDGSIYNNKNVILGEIRGINFDSTTPLAELQINGDLFSRVNEAIKGDYGNYILNKTNDGENYVIYNHSKMNKDFFISYTLEDAIVIHQDMAELVFNLFSSLKENINELEIIIHLPSSLLKPKLYLHNSNGTTDIIDNSTIKVSISDIKKDDKIDFRLLFDKDVMTNKKPDTNIIVSRVIFEAEGKLKEQNEYIDQDYQKLRQQSYDLTEQAIKNQNKDDYLKAHELVKNLDDNDELKVELLVKLVNLESKIERNESMFKVLFTSIIATWILGLIIIIMYFFQKYFSNERVKIDENDPLVINYLFNKKITDNGLISEIIYLINNDIITFNKTNDSFNLKLNKTSKLKESDLRLIKLLFDDSKKVTYEELLNRSKVDYRNFIRLYSNWLNSASAEVEAIHLFENVNFVKVFNIIYAIIGIILGVFLFRYDTYFSSIYMIILALILIIVSILIYKRNKYGISIYENYKSLKNDLESGKELINEENLIYSISLNNFDKIVKSNKGNELVATYSQIKTAINKIIKGAYSSKNFDSK